jgi:ribonuclease HI
VPTAHNPPLCYLSFICCAIGHGCATQSGNPGPGGWAAISTVEIGGKIYRKVVSGGAPLTTNNEMEYQAVIQGLKATREDGKYSAIVYSDSQLVIGQLSQNWKVKAANLLPLVEQARGQMRRFVSVRFVKVRGHSGDPFNEEVDRLAREAIAAL